MVHNDRSDAAQSPNQSTDARWDRRRYLQSIGAVGSGLLLAGCSSGDGSQPDQDTSTSTTTQTTSETTTEDSTTTTTKTTQAALGEVIEGEQLALVAYGVERSTTIGEFTEADKGNEFVIVDMAAKNKSQDEYLNFSSFLQVTLRDAQSYEYDQTITGAEHTLDSGELVPGEVTRGVIVFEVPKDASGLSLRVDLDESIFQYAGAQIDLTSQGSGRTLTQDLRVKVYDVGETIEYEQVRFTPNSVRTSMGDEFTSPEEGSEFVIVDITVENRRDEELSVSTLLQLELKDQAGWTYPISLTAASTLDQPFSQSQPIAPNSQRRGEVAFEAPKGTSPLFLMMDFDLFATGDKTFYQLR